jgi:protein O-mannosyl-transferase
MSKPMLVTLPFILLLLDYWPLQRCQLAPGNLKPSARRFHPLLLEKLPFFALSAASCVVTFVAQTGGGAVVPVAVLIFPQRLANAIVAYATYLELTFWPAHLAVFYPFEGDLPTVAVILSGALQPHSLRWWCPQAAPTRTGWSAGCGSWACWCR